jgi:hypothetical protein
MTSAREAACPLCGAPGPFETIVDVRKRRHRICGRCKLIFVEDPELPSPEAERARYAKHRNTPRDAGYVAFLRQVVVPARPFLNPSMRGLDYGCGHTPTLCGMLAAEGWPCENYDLYFFPDLPEGPFDFLFATEVVEHFFHPAADWARMASLLRPGGILTAMTAPWTDLESFRTWGYASDETHVCFYHRDTLDWIAAAHGFDWLDRANPRVSVLRKR